ncbi:MAG: Cna B-type domain-containing protein, partial [Clostridia bacterium]|nr:Cna B-type domain-containing protein [Clostridia bacterium]
APEITLTLYCNGEALEKKTPTPNEDGWYIWHNLPLTYKGEAAEYTVVEEPLDGFTVSYGEAAEGEEEPTCARDYGTIVNRKIPRTGDESRIGLWIALSAVSACAFILLMKKRKEAV